MSRLHVPFLLRVHADDAAFGAALCGELRRMLDGRGETFEVETAPAGPFGPAVSAAVRDPEGKPRWLAPLRLAVAEPSLAARQVVEFLESWGFTARTAAPRRAA